LYFSFTSACSTTLTAFAVAGFVTFLGATFATAFLGATFFGATFDVTFFITFPVVFLRGAFYYLLLSI
jgi:hypothetical protein